MKYIQKTKTNITKNFLNNLLLDRGIIVDNEDFKEKFFHPTKTNLLDPMLLDNIEDGIKLLIKHLKNKSKIYIVVDPDVDGFTSSAFTYNYLTKIKEQKNLDFTLNYHIPDGKQHGLDTLMKDLEEYKKYDLIILPDSSSNDYNEHEELSKMGYDILVLDHHDAERYSENAIVINNQLSKYYENKNLSGVGVVYKFFQLFDIFYNFNYADDYLDLVALGEVSDMMNCNTLENRYIIEYGLSHILNLGFQEIIKQQSYSLFGEKLEQIDFSSVFLTPIQVAFYITPLINAVIRVGTQIEKENLFKSFITGKTLIDSTKRGHKGERETIAEQSARNCVNARNRQKKEKEKALELLDIQIMNECLDDNKILILNADDLDVSNTLTGLCAMGVVAKYKRPTLLGRISPDNCLKGSFRGVNGSELKDFKDFLSKSNLVEFAEG